MTPRSLAEHGVTWDEDGAPIGFQVGRAAAIQEWRFRKEQNAEAFKRLIKRLQIRRWRTENPDRARETRNRRDRERRTDPRFRHRENAERRARAIRQAWAKMAATIYRCIRAGCEKTWPHPKDRSLRGRRPLFCGAACRSAHYRAIERADPVKGPIARAKELEAQKRRKAARKAKAKECAL